MTLAPTSLPGSGRRKAAITLVALGPERAAALLRELDPAQVRELAQEINRLGPVDPAEVRATLHEVQNDLAAPTALAAPGPQFTRSVLTKALGESEGGRLADELDSPGPFAWLAQADPEQAAAALAEESPAAVALALVHLDARPAARLLTRLPEGMRRQVASRVAQLSAVHPDTVAEVESALRSRVTTVLAPSVQQVAGPQTLAAMLAFATKDTETALLAALATQAPELAEAVRAALFTFDDVAKLEPRALQTLLKAVDTRELALALKSVDEATVSRVLANLSERAREALLEEIDLLTSVRPAETAAAKQSIVATARRLEDEGAIVIARADDEAQV